MGHIVVVTGDIFSVRASAVEMSRRLAASGHELLVVAAPGVLTGSPPDGVRFLEHDSSATSVGPTASPQRWPLGLRAARRRRVERMVDHGLAELIRTSDPDLVVVDAELVPTITNVLATGFPTALFTTFQGTHRDFARPPAHSGIVPGEGLAGSRLGVFSRWMKVFLGKEIKWARAWVRGRGDSQRSRLRRLVRLLGLPRRTVDAHQWIEPLAFPALPVLEFNLAEFDLVATANPLRHLVGPMRAPPERDEPSDDVTDGLVSRVADAREAGDQIVYCSFGTFASSYPVALLQRVVDAVADIDGARLVLGLGGLDQVPDGLTVGPDTIVFGWAPQRRLLEHVDVAVIHGGHATLYECIAAAVPVVALPMTLDQPGYGARVVYHGVGLVGPDDPSAESLDEMTDRIRRVLDSDTMRSTVRELAAVCASARDHQLLERAVADLLRR